MDHPFVILPEEQAPKDIVIVSFANYPSSGIVSSGVKEIRFYAVRASRFWAIPLCLRFAYYCVNG